MKKIVIAGLHCEMVLNSLEGQKKISKNMKKRFALEIPEYDHRVEDEKHHQLTQETDIKVGDEIQLVTGIGTPIPIGVPIRVESVQVFKLENSVGKFRFTMDGFTLQPHQVEAVANGEGYSKHEFMKAIGYPKPYEATLICWKKKLKYGRRD